MKNLVLFVVFAIMAATVVASSALDVAEAPGAATCTAIIPYTGNTVLSDLAAAAAGAGSTAAAPGIDAATSTIDIKEGRISRICIQTKEECDKNPDYVAYMQSVGHPDYCVAAAGAGSTAAAPGIDAATSRALMSWLEGPANDFEGVQSQVNTFISLLLQRVSSDELRNVLGDWVKDL